MSTLIIVTVIIINDNVINVKASLNYRCKYIAANSTFIKQALLLTELLKTSKILGGEWGHWTPQTYSFFLDLKTFRSHCGTAKLAINRWSVS